MTRGLFHGSVGSPNTDGVQCPASNYRHAIHTFIHGSESLLDGSTRTTLQRRACAGKVYMNGRLHVTGRPFGPTPQPRARFRLPFFV